MRIVLLGAPGSGKGTQAKLLVEELGVPHISTGDLFRAAIKAGTEVGLKARAIIDRGDLVPDDITLALLEERIHQPDARGGFILDGYPRNLAQAEALDALLGRMQQPVQEAIQIDVDSQLIIERISARAAQEGRTDDTSEVVRNRLDIYAQQTAPVVDYYAQRDVLSRVYGVGSIEEVFARIRGILAQAGDDS